MASPLDELVAPPDEQQPADTGYAPPPLTTMGGDGSTPGYVPPVTPDFTPPAASGPALPQAPAPLDTSDLDARQSQIYAQIEQLQKTQEGTHPKAWIQNLRNQQRELQTEAEGIDFQRQTATRADRAARATVQQAQQQQRLTASDLQQRGIPTYRDATSGVTPVTDETGAPLTQYDPRHAIAYDTSGQPREIVGAPTGPPKLTDPFANLPTRTDPKTGDEYKVHPGLPWQWQGTDPDIQNQRMQEVKDKALTQESQLLGRKLSLDHADLVAGDAEAKQMTKELQTSVPTLQDPRLQGADRATILKAIDDHFNTEYAQPAANETNGWFSKDLSPAAQQLRETIDQRKATAMQSANDLFDLKQKQSDLSDKVAAERGQTGAELDTVIAHKRGQLGPLDPGYQPTISEPSVYKAGQVDPQTITDAKAGKKSYTLDDQNNVQFDPKNLSASAQQAADDGLIDPQKLAQVKPQLDQLQKANDDRQKLIDAAGNNPKLKALLSGAVKGSAFAAGFPLGAGVGATAGAAITAPLGELGGLGPTVGAIIGGLITGTIASKGTEAIIKKVGDYNDTIHSLSASSELHPNYDLAGNLISFGAGAFTKGASEAVGKGVDALGARLAGASAVEGATAEQIAQNIQRATAIQKAADAGEAVGTADKAWAAKTLDAQDAASKAAIYSNGIARSYYGSGGGLWNTVQNLKDDASIRAAASASDADPAEVRAAVAKAIAYRVGGVAAANVAIDTIVNTGMYAAGLQPHGETWQNAGAAALLGAFTAGHGMEFEGYNKEQVGNIIERGKVRMDNGLGLSDSLPVNVMQKMARSADPNDPNAISRLDAMRDPLTAKEQEVYEAFGRRMLELQRTGQLPMDPNTVEVSARQALQGGQPIKNTAVEIRPGEAPPAPPPAPEAPKIGAPPTTTPTGEPPDVRGKQPEPESPVSETTPTVQPPRDAGTEGQPVGPNVPGTTTTAAPIPPTSPEPGGTGGITAGGTTGGSAGAGTPAPGAGQPPATTTAPPAEGGPQVPAGTPPATHVTPPPAGAAPAPAVNHAVGDKVTLTGKNAGEWTVAGVGGGHTVLTNTETGNQTVVRTDDLHNGIASGKVPIVRAGETVDTDAHGAATSPTNEKAQPTQGQLEAGNYEKGHTEIGPEGSKLPITIENPVGSQRSNLDVNAVRDLSAQIKAATTKAGGVGAGAGPSLELAISSAEKGEYQLAKTQLGAASKWLAQHGQPELAQKVAALNTGSYATELKSHYGYMKGTVGADKEHVDVFVKEGTPKNYDGPVFVVDQTVKGPSGKFDEHKAVIGAATHEEAVREYQQNYQPGAQGNFSGVTKFNNIADFKQWLASGAKGPAAQSKGVVKAPPKATPQVPPLPGMGPIGAKPPKEVAKPTPEAQPPAHGAEPKTLPPTETPPTAVEGHEPGADEGVQQLQPGHSEAESAINDFQARIPRSIRATNIRDKPVAVVRVPRAELEGGGGLAARGFLPSGRIEIVHAPELVQEGIDDIVAAEISKGATPEEAKATAMAVTEAAFQGEHLHAREYVYAGVAQINAIRDRIWAEMKPLARQAVKEAYDMELPPDRRNRVLASEYTRMKMQVRNGITPEEAYVNPEGFAKVLPFLQDTETPFIEAHLRGIDDITKQDTELPFRTEGLNELYQYFAKQDMSDANAQKNVLFQATDGYPSIDAAFAAGENAPADFTHVTPSGHTLDREAFREAVDQAKEQSEYPEAVPSPPAPQVLSEVPRKPPIVPKEIGGPGPISDTDMGTAESVPMYEASGPLATTTFKMLDGTEIGVTYRLVDSRLVVDNPDNEQPDASYKETQQYLLATSGENYDARLPFIRTPTFQEGPGIVEEREGRFVKNGGHRRHYRDLINREKYEAGLLENAHLFGFAPDFVTQMQEHKGWPYLVAVIDDPLTPEQRDALGRQLNTPKAQPKNPIFEAVSAGRNLKEETIDTAGKLFEDNPDSTPMAALQLAAAKDLSTAMLNDGAIRATDAKRLIAANGAFTKEGADFARMALVGNVIPDPDILERLQHEKAMTKLLNAIGPLYIMKRRGQDMDAFTKMLHMEHSRIANNETMEQFYANLEAEMFNQRDTNTEAVHKWFNSFNSPQAKKAFLKALNDYLPLEKGQVDLMAQNIDLGEGLIRDKNLDTLMAMKPGKGGGLTAEEKVLKALKEKEASGKKLTAAEHDLILKAEKKLGQKLLIDPNKTPRKLEEPEMFPEETPEVEPKRAKLGGQSELDILAPGLEKSGQQTLFNLKPKLMAVSQPPKQPVTTTGDPSELYKQHQVYQKDLAKWLEQIPIKAPIAFSNPERPNNVAVVTPVVPRTEAALESKVPGALLRPTKEGQWRVTTFYKPMVPQLTDQMVMKMQPGDFTPSGHDEHDSRTEAVRRALQLYPKYSPDVLFAQKPKGPTLPGFPTDEINWKAPPEGMKDDQVPVWHGSTRDVSYTITEVVPGSFQIHFFNNGNADVIGSQPTLAFAKKAAETHLAQFRADERNGPVRRESYRLQGPKARESGQGEFRFEEPKERKVATQSTVSLLTSRGGFTQVSPYNYLPERFTKILKLHQRKGSNLALYQFDGGQQFLLGDGPGAGKTAQQLAVASIMAGQFEPKPYKVGDPVTVTSAVAGKEITGTYQGQAGDMVQVSGTPGKAIEEFHADRVRHAGAPIRKEQAVRQREMPEGMVRASLIITENERIIRMNYAKDAEMLGVEAWHYRGDDPKEGRVYLATYTDVRTGLVPTGKFSTVMFDESQNLRNAGYGTSQAIAGTKLSASAQHVLYASATPFDKAEQVVYLKPLIGEGAYLQLMKDLKIRREESKPDKKGKVNVRYHYPDDITEEDVERAKEALFNELTRKGQMISRNVPLNNVDVKYVEVPITDEAFIHADDMYRRIFDEVKEKSAMNAGGVAGMSVRAYLESQKIDSTIEMVHEAVKNGEQVVVFASRIKEGTAGTYQEGIEGTLDRLHAELEMRYGKGSVGRVYGGDTQRAVRDIDRYQRNEIKIMLATPNSGGTGINLDDVFGDTPRTMIIITAPMSAIELVQEIGRINRLTTRSRGTAKILFVDHPVDTWNIDIGASKLRTLSATVGGDLRNVKPLKQRTEEIKLNDDASALAQVDKISELEARERLTSPNKAIKAEAQAKADKFFKDIQDETDRLRNQDVMSDDEIMHYVDDEQAFSELSPGHAKFQKALRQYVVDSTITPTDAELLRALAVQSKGDFLDKIQYLSNPQMSALGRGGKDALGRPVIELSEGQSTKHNPVVANSMANTTLHEYGHAGYYTQLSVPERRMVARIYAKLGGRSGSQAYFVSASPQKSQSNSRYFSKNVYEFFAQSFAEYVFEKRVPGEIMQRFHDRMLSLFTKRFELLRRRKDISREPGLLDIYNKILDLKANAKNIDKSYPDRASLLPNVPPPKGKSRGELERYYQNKADIYNSLATGAPPTGKGTPKFSTVPERITPRAHPLPYGDVPVAPERIAAQGPKLPYGEEAKVPEAQISHPVATETLLGGKKNHFYITSTAGGHTLFMRSLPDQTLHARSQTLPTYEAAMDVLRKTLEAGAKFGARHVYHEETINSLKPKGERNAPITGKEQVGAGSELSRVPSGRDVRAYEGEVRQGAGGQAGGGRGAVEREAAPEVGTKAEAEEKPAGRGGQLQVKDPADPGQSGEVPADTLNALSLKQAKKLAGVNWVSNALSDVRSLAPTSKSPEHLRAAQDVGRFLGERNRQQEIAKRLIRPSWKMFEKLGVSREDLPPDQHPGSQFASDVSTGKSPTGGVSIPVMITKKMEAQLKTRGYTDAEINKMKPQEANDILRPPELTKAAETYRDLLDQRIVEAAKVGAPLNEIRDHYFPGYWTVQSRRAFNQAMDELIPEDQKDKINVNKMSEAQMGEIRDRVKELIAQNEGSDRDQFAAFARHPLTGPELFRHQAVFDDKLVAEKLGLEPVFPNPADAVMAKLHEMDQSILANKVIQKWYREGKLKIIPPTSKPPDGWREFPDPFGKVWARDEKYGLRLVGKRIVPNEYADIIENYLSPSLYQNRYFGKPFSLWMAFANVLNQTQLGIGSAFHAGFTSAEAQISSIARMMQDIYGVMRGNRTMAQLGATLKGVPTAMYSVPKEGDAVLNAYLDKTPSQDPRIAQVVRAAELAGAGTSIEKGLRTEQSDEAFKDWYSGHKIRAAVRSPLAMIELMAKPIMDYLVPRQKMGVFAHEAMRIIEQNPGKTLEQLTPEFRFLWSTLDARLGQVQYKRLFMNNVSKNVAQMFIRAPGWTGGTILQLGGAVKDAGNFFKEWQQTGSLPKDLPPRTAYAIALVLTTAAMNAALTMLFSGKKPEGNDFFAFRTGREDEHGNPERFTLPTYMKDLYAYGKHPGETILNKTHPALSLLSEIIKNKDYYGVEVRDPDANVVKQAYQSGKHILKAFQPFWWKGATRAAARGAGLPEKVLPLIGVMPAPRALTQTGAQAELEKYWKTHQPEAGISPEQFETQQAKRDLVSQIRRGGAPNLTKAIEKGVIQPRDINALYKRARMGSIASSVDRLPLDEAEKVYAKASPDERQQMSGVLERKRAGSLRRGGRTMYQGF